MATVLVATLVAYVFRNQIPGDALLLVFDMFLGLSALDFAAAEESIGTKVGNSVLIHGAIGEIAPITAMALLLGTHGTWTTLLVMVAFIGVAILVAIAPSAIVRAVPGIGRAFVSGAGSTNQTILRLIVLILATLMAVAAVFELDIVLGAFAAGIILNRIIPDEFHEPLEHRLDVVFYSMLIPLFFVVTGMAINQDPIANHPEKDFACRSSLPLRRWRSIPNSCGKKPARFLLRTELLPAQFSRSLRILLKKSVTTQQNHRE